MKRRSRLTSKINIVLPIVIIIFIAAIIVGVSALTSFNDHTYIITVTDKERINKDSDSKYLLFGDTSNSEELVFENTDNILRLKFNSSNIYGKLKVGETYKITVIGYRIPFLSSYENIIKVENAK